MHLILNLSLLLSVAFSGTVNSCRKIECTTDYNYDANKTNLEEGCCCTHAEQCASGMCDATFYTCELDMEETTVAPASGALDMGESTTVAPASGACQDTDCLATPFAGAETDLGVGCCCTTPTQCASSNCDFTTSMCQPDTTMSSTTAAPASGACQDTDCLATPFAGAETDLGVGCCCTTPTQCASSNCDFTTSMCQPDTTMSSTTAAPASGACRDFDCIATPFAGAETDLDEGCCCSMETQCASSNCDIVTSMCQPDDTMSSTTAAPAPGACRDTNCMVDIFTGAETDLDAGCCCSAEYQCASSNCDVSTYICQEETSNSTAIAPDTDL